MASLAGSGHRKPQSVVIKDSVTLLFGTDEHGQAWSVRIPLGRFPAYIWVVDAYSRIMGNFTVSYTSDLCISLLCNSVGISL